MKSEWDPKKDTANQKKHGIAFSDAITVFDDPFALIAPDPEHSTELERREWIIGDADLGILVVIFTIRDPGSIYRIISARPANRKERKQYEESKRISI
jgi:uncharacterized DUF497 family protein